MDRDAGPLQGELPARGRCGLHLYDVNLALGNLVEVARREAKAYARR
jgi:hypothetical protein